MPRVKERARPISRPTFEVKPWHVFWTVGEELELKGNKFVVTRVEEKRLVLVPKHKEYHRKI